MRKAQVLFLALLFAWSCGKDNGGTETTGQQAKSGAGEPIQMIPDEEFSDLEKLVDAHIKPYFDENGTVSEKSVEPGEIFDVYVVAEFNNEFTVAGAEYRLEMPEGVVVLSSTSTDSMILQLGKWDVDYMVTFRCIPGPRHWISRYFCKATEDFQGGTVATSKGQHLNFLGFTLCDATTTQVKGSAGTAALSRK